MPGVLLTPDRIESMKRDTLHRDAYSVPDRVKAWEAVNRWHMEARETNRGLPPDTGPYLFSADMGESKSHLMITYAVQAWATRAVPVFSVPSVGALFGYLLTYEEMYDFADMIPPGSILIIDEIAALLDVYTSRANRGRTLHAGLTSFRKGGTLLLTATAHEARVSWEMKSSYKAVIKPGRRYPTKQVLAAVKYFTCEPIYKTMYKRAHELEYPPFCYVQARGLIAPWAGRKVFEDYDAYLADMRAANRNGAQGATKWKEVKVVVPNEEWMNIGGKLYDTFQRVPTSDAFGIDSKRLHEHWGRQKNNPIGRFLAAAVAQGALATVVDRYGWVRQDILRDMAAEFDSSAFKGMSAAKFRGMLDAAIGPVQVGKRKAVTTHRVAAGAIESAIKGVGK